MYRQSLSSEVEIVFVVIQAVTSGMSLRRRQRCQRCKDVMSLQREVHVSQRRSLSLKDRFRLCKAYLSHLRFGYYIPICDFF